MHKEQEEGKSDREGRIYLRVSQKYYNTTRMVKLFSDDCMITCTALLT